ncbi:hypothetical protein [Salidesulfovibrio brasiliensis]|uniref:hypothetical protein n=1 Tax=Salidesulfovibrio brasiliensis TaxID=221711 RepID=UPI000AEFE1B9|nr:hypothetical protein [Salidesulfovibrio brasiliensis]
MATVAIDGKKYKVTDTLGYVQDVSAHVKEVATPEGNKMVIKRRGGKWRFWTAKDRV